MAQKPAGLRQMLSRVKPWSGVAVTVAVVLLGYYLVQGWRYWQASGDSSSLAREIRDVERRIALLALEAEAASAELESGLEQPQALQAELPGVFGHQPEEKLMAIVADTALGAGVFPTSMNPEPPRTEVLGAMQYQVQTLSVSVQGSTTGLYRFLSLLHKAVPAVTASGIRIANLDGDLPAARMQLLFYLSPEPLQESQPVP